MNVVCQPEGSTFPAKAQDQDQQAARLFGAAEALRERIAIPMAVQERQEYERQFAELRAGMEARSLQTAWAERRSMTMEQAVDFAVRQTAWNVSAAS